MCRCPVYILAGGHSSRFGDDKARADVHGKPLLAHVADSLAAVATTITVIADHPGKYADLGFTTIGDLRPGLGPLTGLHSALADLPPLDSWLLLGACDAVVLRPEWLEALVAAPREGVDAVAFRGEKWQPMPALYRRSSAEAVARQLDSDSRGLQRLLDELVVHALPLPGDWPTRWQANTREELADLLGGDSPT